MKGSGPFKIVILLKIKIFKNMGSPIKPPRNIAKSNEKKKKKMMLKLPQCHPQSFLKPNFPHHWLHYQLLAHLQQDESCGCPSSFIYYGVENWTAYVTFAMKYLFPSTKLLYQLPHNKVPIKRVNKFVLF